MEHHNEKIDILSARILSSIDILARSLPEEEDWLEIKKQLMLMLHPVERALFSTRDQKTKKHHPYNKVEQAVRLRWYEITGRILVMPEHKMLDNVPKEKYIKLQQADT